MKKQILAEEVDQIINQAFWGKGGVRLHESQQPVEQAQADEETASEEQIEENVEKHVCPLCESHLEKPITDEKLSEHVNFMVEVISEMENLSDDDLQEAADTAESESDEDDSEEDSSEDESSQG